MAHIYFTQRNLLLDSKQQKKMIGHRSRFPENDDLPPWRGPAVKKKPPFSNARAALITRKIMRSIGMRNAILGNDLKSSFKLLLSVGVWLSTLQN